MSAVAYEAGSFAIDGGELSLKLLLLTRNRENANVLNGDKEDIMSYYQLLPSPNYGVIGHRGISAYAPENTLPSFALAKTMNINWVEFDVHLTQCGHWVVIHDDTVDRTTNGQGKVSELSLQEIRSLEAGLWFNDSFKGTQIPTLSELLEQLYHWGIHPNIEVKGDFSEPEGLAESFSLYMTNHYPTVYPQPLISSFSLPLLIRLRENLPYLPLGYLVETPQKDSLDIFYQYGFNTFHADAKQTSLSQIKTLVDAKIPLLMYTVNEKELAQQLFDQGVTALFSDSPDKIISS